MRNIPKYYTNKKLQDRQVLKFGIRHPDPDRQLWNRREESSEHADQECLIENMEQIQETERQAVEQNMRKKKRTLQEEQHGKKHTKKVLMR